MMDLKGKKVSDSRVMLAQMMLPEHANTAGNVHGGWIMKLVDEAGGLACIRHAQRRVVTVAVDTMLFRHPIRIGDLIMLDAELSYVGRSSMEVEVNVCAETPLTGQRLHTNTAYVVYVALDADGNPTEVPPLILETDAQHERAAAGKKRQDYRVRQSKKMSE